MTVKYNYAHDTAAPISSAKVENPTGYWDLLVNKTKNGKAIRISTRTGEDRVNIALDKVDALIEALKAVKARGVKTSVNDLPFSNR